MKNFIAVDIETTGLNRDSDEIIEVGAAKFCNGVVTDTFSSLIHTTKKITNSIEKLTGISNEMIAQAPDAEQVKWELINFCGQEPLVFHNANFDLTFLEKFFEKPIENQILDTLEITKIFFPTLSAYDLGSLANFFELPSPKHRALDDAIACGHLFLKNMRAIDNLKPHFLSVMLSFLKHPSNLLSTIVEQKYYQMAWSSKLDTQDFVFKSIIPKHDYQEKAHVTENFLIDDFSDEKIKTLLSNSSFLEKYPNFEFRTGQIEMLKEVCSSFLENRLFIAEAATGTGKSLAYLLPAALWSVLKNEKVLISTHTINLQEQLSTKDLPIIKNMLGLNNLYSTVIKGRNNYLCLNKLLLQFNSAAQNTLRHNYFMARIVNWLSVTASGDKNELNLRRTDQEYWSSIAADSYSCLGNKCDFYTSCFVTHVKKKAELADILITNHSMLLSDVKTDRGVLPNYKYLIIDEAHNLEQESINHLTIECSSYLLRKLLKNLKQVLENLSSSLGNFKKIKPVTIETYQLTEIEQLKNEAMKSLTKLQQAVFDFTTAIKKLNLSLEETEQNQAKWLKQNIADKDEWLFVENVAQNLIFRLQSLSKDVASLTIQLQDLQEFTYNVNIHIYGQLCEEYAANLINLLNLDVEDKVIWLETYTEDDFSLKQAPLEVGELLAEKIYSHMHSIIFTSATLTIENNFDFFQKQVGLDLVSKERIHAAIYQSPFDYEKQVTLCIPTDLPNPVDFPSHYESALNYALEQMIVTNKGRTLVLFTAYQQLFNCYYALKEPLQKQNINLLAHRIDGSRTSIIERFKQHESSVIFGTNSFWEGVDIPGNSLTLLVVVKLPFKAPSIPTLAAKMEYLRKRKEDPFRNLNLPQAIIRFKQGFGRLVRSQQDTGLVIVMDKRIIEKFYGKKFLNSLPLKTHFRGNIQDIIQMIEKNQNHVKPVI